MAPVAHSDAGPTARTPPEIEGLAAVISLLSRVSEVDALLPQRPAEPQDNRLHIGYSEAAERLNIPEKWIRERIASLPHRKFGKYVQFTNEDLHAISDMHFVKPGGESESESLRMSLQPSKRSRRRS